MVKDVHLNEVEAVMPLNTLSVCDGVLERNLAL